ncbi:MAG: hypothetical protein CME70_11105 [Halobacteriovorax sp.]|nr:hypothetical protein [Halobacteriovorax sp.]|tara:strand:- start:9927 stop:11171 length:1245 start_codon:yes stop_codon:yes gene_type:complete
MEININNEDLLNSIAIVSTLVMGVLLIRKKLIESELWKATVTPLSSIIGSGFLIVAPLLHSVFGKWAPLGMIILSVFGYSIGIVIRFNIKHAENYLISNNGDFVCKIEKISQVLLGLSYAVSVAFYISLFTSFISKEFGIDQILIMKWITTVTLLSVMGLAWWRGTKGLERIELIAVTIKLAVITGVLIALASYDVITQTDWFQHSPIKTLTLFEKTAMLAGMLMVTQGFETTRFMGEHYSTDMRVKASRNSQGIAIVIYIIFIGLTCPIFLNFPIVELNETTVSYSLGQAVSILPLLLLGAAIASQLSAALADTIGAGGLLKEIIPSSFSLKVYYMAVIAAAIFLIWSANVFEIINFASKGFASYFLLQTFIAFKLIRLELKGQQQGIALMGCLFLQLALMFVIFFSIPAPHS